MREQVTRNHVLSIILNSVLLILLGFNLNSCKENELIIAKNGQSNYTIVLSNLDSEMNVLL